MNISKKILLSLIFISMSLASLHASNNTRQLIDDLQKSLNIAPSNSNRQTQINMINLIAIERSIENESTTYFYANGNYETISYVGSQGIREIYDHRTGKTRRENCNRD